MPELVLRMWKVMSNACGADTVRACIDLCDVDIRRDLYNGLVLAGSCLQNPVQPGVMPMWNLHTGSRCRIEAASVPCMEARQGKADTVTALGAHCMGFDIVFVACGPGLIC